LEPTRAQPVKLLIVDDYAVNCELIEAMLGRHQAEYLVRICSSAQQALAAIEQETPDLMMVDVNLIHSQSGISLCKQVKARPEYRQVRVILYSAAELMPEQTELARQSRADLCVRRPVLPAELKEHIRSVLTRRIAADE
jgi:CheY-like chemotaxis protein